jgi:hypothetical protein
VTSLAGLLVVVLRLKKPMFGKGFGRRSPMDRDVSKARGNRVEKYSTTAHVV